MTPDIHPSGAGRGYGISNGTVIERFALVAPFAIVVYVIALAGLRLAFSSFLEVDEAQLVGAVDLRLIYPGGHPPLFHWLTRVLLELTGWDWAVAMAILRYTALGAYFWFIYDTARRLTSPRTALLTLCASAFLPQVIWMSTTTLTHTTLTMALAAAALNMMVKLFEDPAQRRYVWAGVVAGLGMLTSYSFALFLIPFTTVIALEPELRFAFQDRKKVLFGAGAFALLTFPLVILSLIYISDASAGVEQLYSDSIFRVVDIPFVGLDGFFSAIAAVVAWTAPLAAAWLAARAHDRAYGPLRGAEHPFAAIIGKAMLAGLAGLAILTLLIDVSNVKEQHITPLLAALPIYLAIAWPLRWSAGPFAALAGALFLVALPAFALFVRLTDAHRYAIPYDRIAAQIARQVENEVAPIRATKYDDMANLVLALGWPGSTSSQLLPVENADRVILVWRGRVDAPSRLAPEGFGPDTRIFTVVAPLTNGGDAEVVYRFQVFERLPDGVELISEPETRESAPSGDPEPDLASASEPPAAPAPETEVEPEIVLGPEPDPQNGEEADPADAETVEINPALTPENFDIFIAAKEEPAIVPLIELEPVEKGSAEPLNAANLPALDQPQ